ncbi:nucleic acid-binding, OB-fold, replication protein A, OB domain protein [Tanacetum coccineum]
MIIRLWKLKAFKNLLETLKIEMVLQDEEALKEGKCVYISTFGVGDSERTPNFIGDLIFCGNIDHAMVEGSKRPFIRLKLDNLTWYKLRNITLWNDYAHHMNNALGNVDSAGKEGCLNRAICIWDLRRRATRFLPKGKCVGDKQFVLMSHGDEEVMVSNGFKVVAKSEQGTVVAVEYDGRWFYGLQYKALLVLLTPFS